MLADAGLGTALEQLYDRGDIGDIAPFDPWIGRPGPVLLSNQTVNTGEIRFGVMKI
jgi:hypothetical protein